MGWMGLAVEFRHRSISRFLGYPRRKGGDVIGGPLWAV